MRSRLIVLAFLLCSVAPTAKAATYYVRTTGNDTTGDGSTGTPWATLSKALTTVAIGGGDTVLVGPGTYAESTSGLGYLFLDRAFTGEVVVRSETSTATDVVITGATSTAYDTRCQACANLTFSDVTFSPRVNTNTSAFKKLTGTTTALKFERVVFDVSATGGTGLFLRAVTGTTITAVTLTDCFLRQVGANVPGNGVYLNQSGTGTIDGVSVDGLDGALLGGVAVNVLGASNVTLTRINVRTNGSYGVQLNPVTTASLTASDIVTTGAQAVAVIVGTDGEAGAASTGVTISTSRIESALSHGLLIGYGVTGALVDDVSVAGYDVGIVARGSTDVVVRNSRVRHHHGGGLYTKGATNASWTGNTCESAGGESIKMALNGATAPSAATYTGNLIVVSGAAKAFDWPTDFDSGASVVAGNYYAVPQGQFGQVLADQSVGTMNELKSAWAPYGDGTNDRSSMLVKSFLSLPWGVQWSGVGFDPAWLLYGR